MVDEGRVENRARAGVRTWPVGRARNPWDGIWPQAEFAVPARIRVWALAEVGAGRLLPWFAVAFGAGIVLYFAAEHEPAWWAASPLAVIAAIVPVLVRRRPVAFVVALGWRYLDRINDRNFSPPQRGQTGAPSVSGQRTCLNIVSASASLMRTIHRTLDPFRTSPLCRCPVLTMRLDLRERHKLVISTATVLSKFRRPPEQLLEGLGLR